MLFPRVYLCRHVATTSLNIVTQPLFEASGCDTCLPTYRHNRWISQVLPQNSSNIPSVHPVSEFAPLDTRFKNWEPELVFKAANQLTHKNVQSHWGHATGLQPAVSFYRCSTRIFIHVSFLLAERMSWAWEPPKSRRSLPLDRKLPLPVPSATKMERVWHEPILGQFKAI